VLQVEPAECCACASSCLQQSVNAALVTNQAEARQVGALLQRGFEVGLQHCAINLEPAEKKTMK
jgi:hypothetical protein